MRLSEHSFVIDSAPVDLTAAEARRDAARQLANAEFLSARPSVPEGDYQAWWRLICEHQAKLDEADRQYSKDSHRALCRAVNGRAA